MELNDKVTQLEDEIKILKNEVQAVLLDLRESYLNNENPFNAGANPATSQPIIINNQPGPAQPVPPSAMNNVPETIPELNVRDEHPATSSEIKETVSAPALSEPEEEDEGVVEELLELKLPVILEEAQETPEIVYKTDMNVSGEIAREEVIREWRPRIEDAGPFISQKKNNPVNGNIDLDNMAKLAQWIEESVKRLGHERTETVLDIAEMMGHISPELKKILVKFISPLTEENKSKVTTKDYLASLIELATLLGKDNRSEIALLYILCQENEHR